MKKVFRIIRIVLLVLIVVGIVIPLIRCFKPARPVQEQFDDYVRKNIEGVFELTFPKGIKAEYSAYGASIDSSVAYFYCMVEENPAEYFKESQTKYEIERATFEKYLRKHAIKTDFEDEMQKEVPEEYLPKFGDDSDYYCYYYTTVGRVVYLYIVYNAESNSLAVCKQITQYPLDGYID